METWSEMMTSQKFVSIIAISSKLSKLEQKNKAVENQLQLYQVVQKVREQWRNNFHHKFIKYGDELMAFYQVLDSKFVRGLNILQI